MDLPFVGQRITQLRMARNVSEYTMSLALGKSKSYIQGITSGKNLPSMAQLFNICDYLDVSLSDFFSEGEIYSPLYYDLVQTAKGLEERDLQMLLDFASRIKERETKDD